MIPYFITDKSNNNYIMSESLNPSYLIFTTYTKSGIISSMEGGRRKIKQLFWVGASLSDLKEFPEDIKDVFGYALY